MSENTSVDRFVCWLRGHDWGGWWRCVRPDLEVRTCLRCCHNEYRKAVDW